MRNDDNKQGERKINGPSPKKVEDAEKRPLDKLSLDELNKLLFA